MSNVSSVVAICTDGAPECQLNLHYVHWVVPTNSTSTGISTTATATYTYADGSHSDPVPVHTRLEYVLHDTTKERYELPPDSPLPPGLVAHQWLARLSANVPREKLPASTCFDITAADALTGESGVKMLDGEDVACLAVRVVTVPSPQRKALGAFIDHPAMTYTCPMNPMSPCLAFGHVVISAYARNPTHSIYGGGEFARRSADSLSLATPFSSRGVRFEYQAKPTTGKGVFEGTLGPRVLVAIQLLVADRAEVARDMCFKLWTEERETHEVVDVLGYDTHNPHGPPYPPPDSHGVFCFKPVEVKP